MATQLSETRATTELRIKWEPLPKDFQLKLPDENGRHWVEGMGLYVGTWQGTKTERTGYWLRWWDRDGNLLPWAVEQIAQEHQQKERLIAYLQSQGIDPNNLPPFE